MKNTNIQESIKQSKKSSFAPLDMDQWSNIIKQWDKTEESQQAYCKRLNLNLHTFSYVRTKLNRKNKGVNKFIPISVQSNQLVIDSGCSLIFESKNGIKLHIPLSVKENVLLNVLKLIGWSHA